MGTYWILLHYFCSLLLSWCISRAWFSIVVLCWCGMLCRCAGICYNSASAIYFCGWTWRQIFLMLWPANGKRWLQGTRTTCYWCVVAWITTAFCLFSSVVPSIRPLPTLRIDAQRRLAGVQWICFLSGSHTALLMVEYTPWWKLLSVEEARGELGNREG